MAHVLNTLVHLVNVVAYGFTLYYTFFIMHIPLLAEKFKNFDVGQLKYLTIWDVVSRHTSFLSVVCKKDFRGTILMRTTILTRWKKKKQKQAIHGKSLYATLGFFYDFELRKLESYTVVLTAFDTSRYRDDDVSRWFCNTLYASRFLSLWPTDCDPSWTVETYQMPGLADRRWNWNRTVEAI